VGLIQSATRVAAAATNAALLRSDARPVTHKSGRDLPVSCVLTGWIPIPNARQATPDRFWQCCCGYFRLCSG